MQEKQTCYKRNASLISNYYFFPTKFHYFFSHSREKDREKKRNVCDVKKNRKKICTYIIAYRTTIINHHAIYFPYLFPSLFHHAIHHHHKTSMQNILMPLLLFKKEMLHICTCLCKKRWLARCCGQSNED